MPILIPISVFALIVLIVLGAYFLFRPPNIAAERLKQLGNENNDRDVSDGEQAAAKVAERIAEPLNRFVPVSAAKARRLQLRMMHAGYRSPNAPIIYRAIQLISLAGVPLVMVLVLMASGRALGDSLVWIVGAVGVGYLAPRIIFDNLVKGRQERVRCGMADALDLLVVSIEAGLGLNAALVRVSEELKDVHPDVSDEFGLVNMEIRIGRPRDEALRNLGERTGVEDLRSLCAMLIQTDRFGTSIAQAIRIFANSMRTKRRQRAEQAAQKAAVKLLIPLALFLFPTLFIAILGPAFLQLWDKFFNN